MSEVVPERGVLYTSRMITEVLLACARLLLIEEVKVAESDVGWLIY
jgi:hypothetical protein